MKEWLKMFAKIEQAFLLTLIGIIFLLITVQFLHTYPQPRVWLNSLGPMETSEPLMPVTALGQSDADTGAIEVQLQGYSNLKNAHVLVDGRRVASFAGSKVEILVRDQEEVLIDGSFYRRPLSFRVTEVSPGILTPVVGQEITTRGDKAILGKVQFQ